MPNDVLPSGCPVREGDTLVGKYRIESVLGVGGMGVVLRALHIDLGQRVAIELMLRDMVANDEAVARFTREARAAARLQNDHVVRVMDVSRLDSGEPFMVMEHLRGRDLSEVLRSEGPQPVAVTVDRVLQACEAIAEAHAAGIVHRDLKPSNLFLAERPDGTSTVKVLDFGILKVSAGADGADAAMTATNTMLGSPAYMSPDHVRSAKSVDARSDIWAIGMILYELLTARPAFQAESVVALVACIAMDPAIPPRRHRPELPDGLERVILACLEKDPDRRPPNVGDLAWLLAPFGFSDARSFVSRIRNLLGLASHAGRMQRIPSDSGSAPIGTADTLQVPEVQTRGTFGVTADEPRQSRHRSVLAIGVVVVAPLLAWAAWRVLAPSPPPPGQVVAVASDDPTVPPAGAATSAPASAAPLLADSAPSSSSSAEGTLDAAASVQPASPTRAAPVHTRSGGDTGSSGKSPPERKEPKPSGGGEIDYTERK